MIILYSVTNTGIVRSTMSWWKPVQSSLTRSSRSFAISRCSNASSQNEQTYIFFPDVDYLLILRDAGRLKIIIPFQASNHSHQKGVVPRTHRVAIGMVYLLPPKGLQRVERDETGGEVRGTLAVSAVICSKFRPDLISAPGRTSASVWGGETDEKVGRTPAVSVVINCFCFSSESEHWKVVKMASRSSFL